MDSSDSESKLISLVTQFISLDTTRFGWGIPSHIFEIISLLSSMDLDSMPKPESELMSVTSQIISVFNSMDLNSQPEALSKVISLITDRVNDTDSDSDIYLDSDFEDYIAVILNLEPEPELLSLIYQVFTLVSSMNSKWEKLISVRPQVVHRLGRDKIYMNDEQVSCRRYNKWACLPKNWFMLWFMGEDDETHFLCRACEGQNHKEHNNAPVEIKHHLHPKHSLLLVNIEIYPRERKCYCCDEDLGTFFYHCSACDFTLNIACVEKPPVLSIDHPKWHEHTLVLFSRTTSLTCDVCALAYSTSPFYICPPCGFVVHGRCIDLPRVIRISRHPHRISFTPSFHQGNWFCGVCRRKIENDFGGYSCVKYGCSYAAHSRCATQSNVWDGVELEGEPEEDIEEIAPFVRISDGIIQHFIHQYHHLRLDENTCREYDEDRLCQACITPIYFGNLYSCMQCGFVLHEKCAELSRKIHHPIHPHMLSFVARGNGVRRCCSACPWLITTGFFYRCEREECDFQLHVQCATVSEPLVHESHMHPLFLTSKPGEWKDCSVCKESNYSLTNEKFNCIEECDFALCFGCATLPQKVRYKYDKHMLTLSYGKETSTMTYWCEACEGEIDPKKRFYMCDEYCCVTLHINCMLGADKYMDPGSWWLYKGKFGTSSYLKGKMLYNLPNNHHMSRPSCSLCKRRCPYKIVFKCSGSIYCSTVCIDSSIN